MDGLENEPVRPLNPRDGPNPALVGLGLLGMVALGLALWALQPVQFKVVSYTTVHRPHTERYWPALLFASVVCLSVLLLAGWTARSRRGSGWRGFAWLLWPLILCAPLSGYAFLDRPPPFLLSFLMILGLAWAAFRAATHLNVFHFDSSEANGGGTHGRTHGLALGSILLLIALLTLVHTRIQINFFDHFMLGHADIGHFTEELKNALAGRGLRSDSFDNTRLGWHFVPLMYLLVPGYALWPSPVFLMVCGVVMIHVVALPAYYLARWWSGSAVIGWMWGVAWLLLPSLSRLVYGNTYGFQWNNMTMPILALVIVGSVTRRWWMCVVMLVLLLLCRETAAAAAMGWGMAVLLFTPRRKLGLVMALGSIVYWVLCVKVLIPHYAATGRYERLDLFGDLGHSVGDLLLSVLTHPNLFFSRLLRTEGLYLFGMMLIPLALLPLRGWRITLAALPTLIPLLLLANADWLSIKFWHHASILPFFFFGAVTSMIPIHGHRLFALPWRACGPEPNGPTSSLMGWLSGRKNLVPRALNRGLTVAVLVSAAFGHYLYGFSPVAKIYGVYAHNAVLHQPDPRLDVVRRLRSAIPHDRTILATERMAMHFTDYRRIFTGVRDHQADFVILDRADTWDRSGLPQSVSRFEADPRYRLYGRFGSLVVFQRRH